MLLVEPLCLAERAGACRLPCRAVSSAMTRAPFSAVVALVTSPCRAYALIFMAPFLVILCRSSFLRERISWLGIVAMIVGFAGVLIVVRPGIRALEVGHLFAAIAAFFVALSTILIRRIASTEKRTSLLIMPQLVTAVGAGVVMTDALRHAERDRHRSPGALGRASSRSPSSS